MARCLSSRAIQPQESVSCMVCAYTVCYKPTSPLSETQQESALLHNLTVQQWRQLSYPSKLGKSEKLPSVKRK